MKNLMSGIVCKAAMMSNQVVLGASFVLLTLALLMQHPSQSAAQSVSCNEGCGSDCVCCFGMYCLCAPPPADEDPEDPYTEETDGDESVDVVIEYEYE